ncbi:MAG: PIN domain-containing protein [Acidobacteria bacterium]|nr:PIN domain-containing protein [Acidobacteriota bacterium]
MAEVSYLIDTNILLRLLQPDDADYPAVRSALDELRSRGVRLYFTSQNFVEFWNVCTRPADRNGFGLSVSETDRRARLIEAAFTLVADSNRTYLEWRRLVVAAGVMGVQVHDARLVATMSAHGITHMLTLNDQDFARYPEIMAIHPRQLVSAG